MTNTIFDLVEADLPEGKQGYMELAARAPAPKDDSFLNSVKEYGKSALKGAAEGITKLGHVMGPLQDIHGKPLSETREEQTQQLNELLPTQDDKFGANALRRGLKEAPTAMATPFGSALQTLPRAIAAGFAGEGAKQLGAPEWAQTAAELTAYVGPDITKKLLSSGKNKDIIDAARKMGLTDEQITPLIQSSFKQKWLSKLSTKHGTTQEKLSSTKEGLSKAYEGLKNSPIADQALPEQTQKDMLTTMSKIISEMPHAVRSKIKEDARDLLKGPITSKSIMNFWADVNHNLDSNAKQLSLLKDPLLKGIKTVSPELAEDFQLVNDLWGKYSNISSKLKPGLADEVIRAAEAIGMGSSFLMGITTGYYPPLVASLGEKGARILAREMLTNPRFQQISGKMVQALNQNKVGVAMKLVDLYRHEINKFDPIAASNLEDITEAELRSLFESSNQKEEPKTSTSRQRKT